LRSCSIGSLRAWTFARDQTPGLPGQIGVIVAELLARLHVGLWRQLLAV